MAELMGMDVRQSGLTTATLDRLLDAGLGQPAALAEPEPWLRRVGPLRSRPEIPIDRLAGPVAERARPGPAAFAEDDGRLGIEVDVLRLQSGQLAAAHPCI